MPRHLWIDASAGVAGDMLLGALVDAGADLATIAHAIDSVIPGSVRLDRSEVIRAGQRATKIDVTLLVEDPPHRSWRTIEALLVAGELDSSIALRASSVFARLAEVEGHVHGIDPADVHFHEVGALDSLADVIGVCAALHHLDVTTISSGEIALGSGRTAAAHGDIPVPVPAVAELATRWRVTAGGAGELTTPTGMALIATLADACEELPSLVIEAIGVGAGTRDTRGRPNVTRVILGERTWPGATVLQDGATEDAVVLEANIDDLDPRLWPGILATLLDEGASDAWLVPILMKKGRPAHTVSVLCRPGRAASLREVIFAQTSTIGVREFPVRKHALNRSWSDVAVRGGSVTIKIADRGGSIIQVTPEFESVATLARLENRPQHVVLGEAIAAAWHSGLVVGGPLPANARPTRNDQQQPELAVTEPGP